MELGVLIPVIGGLAFAGIGGVLAVSILVDVIRARQSVSWPKVQGRVIASKVTKSEDEEGITYSADVNFEYEVDGIRYQSDNLRFGPTDPVESAAKAYVNAYYKDREVNVYYTPDEPSVSVLIRKLENGLSSYISSIYIFVFGLIFFTVGIYILTGGIYILIASIS